MSTEQPRPPRANPPTDRLVGWLLIAGALLGIGGQLVKILDKDTVWTTHQVFAAQIIAIGCLIALGAGVYVLRRARRSARSAASDTAADRSADADESARRSGRDGSA